MSKGFGGCARKVLEDDHHVIYEYYAIDANDSAQVHAEPVFDGLITIDKTALVEPEIHTHIKRWPSGRKETIVKRIRRDVEYGKLIEEGKIQFEPASHDWEKPNCGTPPICIALMFRIFNSY